MKLKWAEATCGNLQRLTRSKDKDMTEEYISKKSSKKSSEGA